MFGMSLTMLWMISFFVSLAAIIFANWYEGSVLDLSIFWGMALMSAVPLLNLIIALSLLFHVFDNKVILKGRTK